jgi:DNA-directed RNA polymerase specialized sigma24 family protein
MSSWPVTILRRLVPRGRVAIQPAAPTLEEPGEGGASSVEEDVLATAEPSDVMSVFETLPPVLAEPLRLVVVEERSYASVAEQLNIPVEALMARACSARELLLQRLVEGGEAGPFTPGSFGNGAAAPRPLNFDMTA